MPVTNVLSLSSSQSTYNRKPSTAEKLRDYIGNRDNWICGICGQSIDSSVSYTIDRDNSAAIDHIIPKCLGGSDENSNLQIAHWLCNNLKGKNYPYSYIGATPWHGTNGGYINHYCRCTACSNAHEIALNRQPKSYAFSSGRIYWITVGRKDA